MSLPAATPKCPRCHQSDIAKLDGQCAVCRKCSRTKRSVYRFCWACQREWPSSVSSDRACTLPNCALRATLLSVTQINDPRSSANGCPYFRACPVCKDLLTHSGVGCPNIICPQCGTRFCFRCLQRRCFPNVPANPDIARMFSPRMRPCIIVDNNESLAALGL